MGSFFSEYPAGLLDESTGVSQQKIMKLLDEAISELEADPNSPIRWAVMRLFVRTDIDMGTRARVSKALRQLNLVEMVSHKEFDLLTLQIIGTCTVRFGENESNLYLLEQLNLVAKYYASKFSGKVPRVASASESKSLNALRQLVEGAAALSQSDDLSESLGLFGEILVSLANSWPGAAPVLLEVADNTIRNVSLESAGKLWKSVLTLRTMQ